MNKTKEYVSDAQQMIVELHKIENDCKKLAKASPKYPHFHHQGSKKVPTKDVTNLPGRGCVYIFLKSWGHNA